MQYKLDVLNYMDEQGTSIRETAAIFNIPAPSTLFQWKKLLETKRIEALPAENERFRMENAYLKKLNALVQNKEKLRNKIKHE